jgi:hypothetical protein
MAKYTSRVGKVNKVIERQKVGPGKDVGARMAGAATKKIKKITGGGSVLQALGAVGAQLENATLQKLEETDYTHNPGRTDVPLEVEKAAIVASCAGGASPQVVEAQFGVHKGYVAHALARRFGSPEQAKRALHGLVLENALACQVHAAANITEMTPVQAVMSGAVLIDKALAIEKSLAEAPKTIDFGALQQIGSSLARLKERVPQLP